jgi:hypothetical protein
MASIDNILEVIFFFHSPLLTSFALSSFSYFALVFQNLQNQIFIPLKDNLHKIFLGPMGDLDPSRVIIAKTNRIPFKHSTMHPNIWDKKSSIRIWPSVIPGWGSDQGVSQEKNKLGSSQIGSMHLFVPL